MDTKQVRAEVRVLRLIGLLFAVLAGAFLWTLLTPIAVFAATDEPVESGIVFDVPWLVVITAVTTVLWPTLVGLVTNSNWSGRAKGILHLLLSAASGFLAELTNWLTNGGEFNIGLALFSAGVTFGLGVSVYLGIMKPVGKSGESIAAKLERTFITATPNTMGGR